MEVILPRTVLSELMTKSCPFCAKTGAGMLNEMIKRQMIKNRFITFNFPQFLKTFLSGPGGGRTKNWFW
jgi:hypothetical protein